MAQTLLIRPTRFIASGGKLDSTNRYIRRVYSGWDLRFVVGQNMDVRGGGLRYVDPNGNNVDDSSYNGSFSGVSTVGIKV
jgi:hypothetical protein